jgi:Zn finger protein HypA/HybF involved in hydrogenase expression
MPNSAEPIRCPYCRDGNEFRLLVTRTEGWLQCESCGHNAMPLDPEFKCACSKCDSTDALAFMTKITEAD